MFDISFTELLVVAIIALFVIGPERLPQTVKEISLWIGRLKRSLRETRRELEQQIGADEIRRTLHNENVMKSLEDIKRDVEDTINAEVDVDKDKKEEYVPPADYELPPHDPNNEEEEPEPEQDAGKNKKPVDATVTAEHLLSGNIPFESAAEVAAGKAEKAKQTADDAATVTDELPASDSNPSTADSTAHESSGSTPVEKSNQSA